MLIVDYAILAILLVSTLISFVRGFVKEALSLAGWVLAFWVSLGFASPLADHFKGSIGDPNLRLITAFAVLFVATLIVTSVANFFASRLVQATGLSGTDRFLGLIFGFLRGMLLVAVLVFIGGLTSLPQESWWKESLLLFRFEVIAQWMRDLLPARLPGGIG